MARFIDPFLSTRGKQQDFIEILQRATERKDKVAQLNAQILSDLSRNIQRMITAQIRERQQQRELQRELLQAKAETLGILTTSLHYFVDPEVRNNIPKELKPIFDKTLKIDKKGIDFNFEEFVKEGDKDPTFWFFARTYLNTVVKGIAAKEMRELRERGLELQALNIATRYGISGIPTLISNFMRADAELFYGVTSLKIKQDIKNVISEELKKKKPNVKDIEFLLQKLGIEEKEIENIKNILKKPEDVNILDQYLDKIPETKYENFFKEATIEGMIPGIYYPSGYKFISENRRKTNEIVKKIVLDQLNGRGIKYANELLELQKAKETMKVEEIEFKKEGETFIIRPKK